MVRTAVCCIERLNPPPQPVSGDISTKQTVAICIRRVSIQSDLSATRIVAAT